MILYHSGRELFLSDSSWFVDDDEAYDKYRNNGESPGKSPGDGASTSGRDDEDGDELDIDELNELEETLSKSIQIQEEASNA